MAGEGREGYESVPRKAGWAGWLERPSSDRFSARVYGSTRPEPKRPAPGGLSFPGKVQRRSVSGAGKTAIRTRPRKPVVCSRGMYRLFTNAVGFTEFVATSAAPDSKSWGRGPRAHRDTCGETGSSGLCEKLGPTRAGMVRRAIGLLVKAGGRDRRELLAPGGFGRSSPCAPFTGSARARKKESEED